MIKEQSPSVSERDDAPTVVHESVRSLAEIERDYILQTYELCNHNKTHTARALGISLRSLRDKLNHYRKQGCAVWAQD